MRFFRSPKGLMTLVLGVLLTVAALGPDGARMWPGVLAAVAVAVAIDVPLLRWREGRWTLPSGAWLTGLFVAMVLSPFEPPWVAAAASAVGILSKYVLRTRAANVFNPAALALVLSFYAFNAGHSWWGALPEIGWWTVALVIATGVFITDRVNKMALVLVFLGVYFLLFTAMAFVGEPRRVVEIFREPDINAVLFFAFFILTDPPTSPVKYGDQIICGVIVAVVAFGIFEMTGAVHYLLSGVLVGNVWEAWRRVRVRQRRRHPVAGAAAATA
jgi:Na+-translocating ferredoxin:NAD+ oxidoreductase RnfD subunit